MNIVINVKKEKGWTSQDVCSKLKGILHIKKIGHTGTLDPNATGVLPICIGRATKICSQITDWDKEYRVQCILGVDTDTYDITGSICSEIKHETVDNKIIFREKNLTITKDDVENKLKSFVGKINQVPPIYSARKINGKKLYEYARAGVEIKPKSKEIVIYDIFNVEIDFPNIYFIVKCSKGTYIRSICHDLGEKLGCGACMGDLVRTKVGPFSTDSAHTIDEISYYMETKDKDFENKLKDIGVKIDEIYNYNKVYFNEEFDFYLHNGNEVYYDKIEKFAISLNIDYKKEDKIFIYDSKNQLVGIYKNQKNKFSPEIFLYENS